MTTPSFFQLIGGDLAPGQDATAKVAPGQVAMVFAGQGADWLPALTEAAETPNLGAELAELWQAVQQAYAPVGQKLLVASADAQTAVTRAVEGKLPQIPAHLRADVAVTMPAIVLAQYVALRDVEANGVDITAAFSCQGGNNLQVAGHSQGILGAELARSICAGDSLRQIQTIVTAVLVGAAAAQCSRAVGVGGSAESSPMLSVRGVDRSALENIISEVVSADLAAGSVSEASDPAPCVELTVVNGVRNFVVSGRPASLQVVAAKLREYANKFNTALEAHLQGGEPLNLRLDYLPVNVPFHSQIMRQAGAVETVLEWAREINAGGFTLDLASVEELARAILEQPVNWQNEIRDLIASGTKYLVDLGPGNFISRLSAELVAGSGAVFVDASDFEARHRLATPGYNIPEAVDWTRFAPRLVRLPDGRQVVETEFTKLTGRSPIVLPAMTPTTVNPTIVAAAANAGNWAEMAGGGQYSQEVFNENRALLEKLLEPGRAAAFNTMFFDRFMWNLQFGVQKIVPKARRAGAPIDAVTIAAGIPERDEAKALIKSLREDGFTYLCLKPGTVEQIRQVLQIAVDNPQVRLIMQVEDGHAGGHHSWENLDDLLLATYRQIRETPGVVLAVGGGIGTPQRATEYLTGSWSRVYGYPDMPVDAVLLGTASMTVKEAQTSPQVKKLLVETPGIPLGADGKAGWVGRGEVAGGMTSGLSHLDADMYEVENSSSRAARLIHEVGTDADALQERRTEIIEALNLTAKPFFGELTEMTYAQVATRLVDLCHPWADWTWQDRVFDFFERVQARLCEADHGQVPALWADWKEIDDAPAALEKLLTAYPQARETLLTPADAAFFVELCRKHHKPMPFVPAIDGDLARWWGTDTLWQSQDPRFPADAVRIIPGPVSVAGIDRVDEPIADMFARYEAAVASALQDSGHEATEVFSRFASASDLQAFLRAVPHLQWNGNLVENPAFTMPAQTRIENHGSEENPHYSVIIDCDSYWDQNENGNGQTGQAGLGKKKPHAVYQVEIPIEVPASCASGGYPVVDLERMSKTAYDLLAGAAGIGSTSTTGDELTQMPTVVKNHPKGSEFGLVQGSFTYRGVLGTAHGAVTGGALQAKLEAIVPDALVGPSWPVIYAALGTAMKDGIPVIEGLVNAVHLDHTVKLAGDLQTVLPEEGETVTAWSRCAQLAESSAGRVVRVEVDLFGPGVDPETGTPFAQLIERFAIRGRVTTTVAPPVAPAIAAETKDTPRSFMRRVKVTAPADMTAFANVSGDFNPIHTSYAAARLSGLHAPLVHGMWLSATAQHALTTGDVDPLGTDPVPGRVRAANPHAQKITAWSYQMFGMVNLGDQVEITVERTGLLPDGRRLVEATCRIRGEVVSIGKAVLEWPKTAYVFPGQGIQKQGMGMDGDSETMREVWKRADLHTRDALGFSIETIVRDNPTELVIERRQADGSVETEVLRHPAGVLNLTQFTQVALATLAYAQTEDLKAKGLYNPNCVYAGHSLGEYNALSACAQIFPLEQVLEIVYQRGSAMHHLVERDHQGRSNYRMGALRPNQFGMDDKQVREYIKELAETSGQFMEIVNFNLAGSQYAVAGTIEGLELLERDSGERAAKAGGKRPFMLIPGIDVPFHSSKLHAGVPAFRQRLDALMPAEIDPQILVGRYIPNLVARPFSLDRDFIAAVCETVPSQLLAQVLIDYDAAAANPGRLARTILLELLAWQFASPVRWIETQDVLFADAPTGLGVADLVEVGLASAPTLANLAEKTLQLPHLAASRVTVLNVERDKDRVNCTDSLAAPDESDDFAEDSLPEAPASKASSSEASAPVAASADQAGQASEKENTPAQVEPVQTATTPATPAPAANAATVSADSAPDLPMSAADAVKILLAYANKINLDQVQDSDTVDTLTNGVSSKRNQLLMDMAAELGVPNIEGAADANIADLLGKVNAVAGSYRAFGPVLGDAVTGRLRKLFGAAGLKASFLADHLGKLGLPASWEAQVGAQILLGTRTEASVRGGELGTLPGSVSGAAEASALVDVAIDQVAARAGVTISRGAGSAGGGAVVDSAELEELRRQLLGGDGVLATQARAMLKALGAEAPVAVPTDDAEAMQLALAVDAELGAGWLESVTPAFDPNRAVLLDDRWASAREDLARIFTGQLPAVETSAERFAGFGPELGELANFYADKLAEIDYARAGLMREIAAATAKPAPADLADDVALVTGAAPKSIAAAVVARLLAQGATVVMTASRINQNRLEFAKELYRENAVAGAKLWLVPANLSSLRDIDALVEWVTTAQNETVGAVTKELKPALVPTLFYPFAAPSVRGSLGSDPARAEREARLLVWSVERAIDRLTGAAKANGSRVHVVLPGSPNRGTFGGDGAYGESKAAFDAICNKWFAERGWPTYVTLAHPRIGWVAGTALMGANDVLVPLAQEKGIHVFNPTEISRALVDLASVEARRQAQEGPVGADLTGGLEQVKLDLPALVETAAKQRKASQNAAESDTENGREASENGKAKDAKVAALPSPTIPKLAAKLPWQTPAAKLADQIVIVGVGEVGAWGSRRTRTDAENGEALELTAAGVLELAWMMNLIKWQDSPTSGWVDADGNPVAEAEIFDRYHDQVVARCGIRHVTDDGHLIEGGSNDVATVFLDSDQEFAVDSREDAEAYLAADPSHTQIWVGEDGQWMVRKQAGAAVRVPRRATLTRFVAGQLPDGFDPSKWGIPAQMISALDRIAVWNLVTAVDAFVSAGFSPMELLQAVHPASVSSTQGTGIGGMMSLRKVFLDRFLGEDRPQDILQEALPNVVAAHTMQSYVGGYGQMIHSVGACATAAVSIEEAVDKIRLGKSDFVVAGGIDDISVESLTGFGDMNATADTATMLAKGIDPRFISRAGDRRRGGFLEAAGGGTVLVTRGDIAADLGLPVLAVVAFAQSFADGAHTSIPAPGIGALAAGRGGTQSVLAKSLAALGATPDDIAVVSKHDTSTNANDPNEAELHARLSRALGRTAGNPLYVISQKTLTGHAKAGAALFQVAGLCSVFTTGQLPANRALDCLDPVMAAHTPLVWLRRPLDLRSTPVRAAVLTSLGFGHVAALVALVHPGAFMAALEAERGTEAYEAWRARAQARLLAGRRRLEEAMCGGQPLFEPIEGRRLPSGVGINSHEVEAALLLNPSARLGGDGFFPAH